MANNIFDTSGAVAPVTRNETPIMQGVVDKTAARTIGAVTDVANAVTGQIVTNKVEGEVRNILENPETQSLPPEVEADLARLDGVANGVKAGMQKRKAQMMARTIAAEAINQHPFYAKEIRQRLSGMFGGGATGSGGASVEETPQEQAINEYEKAIADTQLQLGVNRETAQELIQSKADNEFRKLRADNFRDDLFLTTTEVTNQMQQSLYQALQETEGKGFAPEQIHQFNMEINRSAVQLQKTLFEAAAQRGAITENIQKAITSQVDEYKKSMKSIVEDSTTQKWIQQNTDLANSVIENRGTMSLGGLQWLAKNDLMTDADKTALWGALRGDERAQALLNANPSLKNLVRTSQNLTKGLRKGYNFAMNVAGGVYNDPFAEDNARDVNGISDDELAASMAVTLNTRRSGAKQNLAFLKGENQAGSQELIDLSLKKAPESIRRWAEQDYIQTFRNDKELMKTTVHHELDVVSRTIRSQIILDGEDVSPEDINFSTPRADMEEVGGGSAFYGPQASAPKFLVSGEIPDATKSRIYDMYKVLEANPMLWEDRYDDPSEYVEDLINRPPDWKYPRRMRKNKARNLDGEINDGINRNSENA